MSEATPRQVLGDAGARQLANTQKTIVQTPIITPRWLPRFLSWVPVEAGVYRVNRTKDTGTAVPVVCTSKTNEPLPTSYVDYVEKPRYLVSLYCSAAVLTDDALGVLENVDGDHYHDYVWPE